MSSLPGFFPFRDGDADGEAYRVALFDWVRSQPVDWSWYATLTVAGQGASEESLDRGYIDWIREVEGHAFEDLSVRQRKLRQLPWIRVIELSGVGEAHVHALIGGCDHLAKSRLEKLWYRGNALVTEFEGLDSALGYTLKALPRGANINFSRSVFPPKG